MGLKIYTRQELIDELLRFESENGRIPKREDIASTRGYPPIKQYYREFGSFKNALVSTPFVTKQIINYTRDILISKALLYEELHGKVPSYNDIHTNPDYPPIKQYIKEFGSWKNATIEIPFVNKEEVARREVKIYTDQELKDFLLKRYDELGKIPEGDDMDTNLGYPCVHVYYARFGSFSGIKEEVFYNKEWLKKYLLGVKEKLGRLPRARDMVESKGFIPVTRFEKPFGSWNNAVNETFYTEEYVQKEFKKFEEKYGRLPTTTDFQHAKGQIPYHRIEKIHGSWSGALYNTPFETTIDHSFFSPENMNLRKWYIVGYIIGDGCISDSGQLNITSTEKDKDNLYNIYNYMKIDTKMDVKDIKGCQTRYSILKFSPRWVKDLSLYGITKRKSHTSFIPIDSLDTVEEEAAIMRGIWDADGSINYRKTIKGYEPVFFLCGSKQLITNFADLLWRDCDIDCKVLKHSSIFRLQIYGIDKCKRIFDFLYGHDNFYLTRKQERFEKLINGTFAPENDVY